jgi:hypothetical protein
VIRLRGLTLHRMMTATRPGVAIRTLSFAAQETLLVAQIPEIRISAYLKKYRK